MINENEIKSLTTNIQDASEYCGVFYKNNNSQLLNERLKSSKAKVVYVLNNDIALQDPRIINLSEDEFEKKKNELINKIYPNWSKVKVIGVTGTNGKSSIVHFLQALLKQSGKKAFSIGTIGIFEGDKELLREVGATTPSEIDLKRILHTLCNYEYACIEVSSHALDQNRLNGVKLAGAIFTNLTQDHLDYHKTMDNYFEAKLKITKLSPFLVIPPNEEELKERLDRKQCPYIVSENIDTTHLNECFKMNYNMKNLSVAKKCLELILGKEINLTHEIVPPKGRFNTTKFEESIFVVDYAHTPDAIESLTRETRLSFPGYEIILIFGCGGDRDRTKRPRMLAAGLKYADKIVVTSDNPRTENATQVIADIMEGKTYNNVEVIENRREAISRFVKRYEKKTIVLIAGKGHEEYQEINGVKHHFSDQEEILKNIENLK